MRSWENQLKTESFVKTNLEKELEEALKNPVVKDIAKKTKLPKKELKKYTSFLEESAMEYSHCLECKGLLECKNRIRGHVYFPAVRQGHLEFEYKTCRYQEKDAENKQYLKNIRYFHTPGSLKEANIDSIYKNDKSRFEAILWLGEFLKSYPQSENKKGLYLHGNFGCGKTYLIAALFNEVAKKGYKSAILFWPEFLRQAFYDDFKEKYDYVKKVPLLLIDDIGAENVTAWNRDEILCPLLQYRMDEGLTTFFTSNLTLEDLEQHLANSKAGVESIKAGRIISRIKQLSDPLEMISKNLRK